MLATMAGNVARIFLVIMLPVSVVSCSGEGSGSSGSESLWNSVKVERGLDMAKYRNKTV